MIFAFIFEFYHGKIYVTTGMYFKNFQKHIFTNKLIWRRSA